MKQIAKLSKKTIEEPSYYELAIKEYKMLLEAKENSLYSNGLCNLAMEAIEKFAKTIASECGYVDEDYLNNTHNTPSVLRQCHNADNTLDLPYKLRKSIEALYSEKNHIRYPEKNKTFLCTKKDFNQCIDVMKDSYLYITQYILNNPDKFRSRTLNLAKKEKDNVLNLSIENLTEQYSK